MYPFTYKVRYCGDFDNYEVHRAQGVTFGLTFVEAMEHVEAYYGNEMIDCILTPIDEEQSVIELSAREVDELERNV